MAAQFGKTWWGQKWLQALNNIDFSNRLPRGSAYAKKGAVTTLKVDENRINAKVAGSRPKPYNVDIILPPFFEPELSRFIDVLAAKPLIISKLLNRELDPEVLGIAGQQGLKVFPQQWTDFKMQCSCPDWAVPCKHLAAVIYKVSAEIDNNPFLVFELHLLDLIAELNKRGLFIDTKSVEVPLLTDLYFEREKPVRTRLPEFDAEQAYQKLVYTGLSPIDESLFSLLSESPVFYTGKSNFKEKYTGVLTRAVRDARKVIQGKMDMQQALRSPQIQEHQVNGHSTIRVMIDEQFTTVAKVNDEDFSLAEFMVALSRIPAHKTRDYQPSSASLHTLFRLSLHLLANGAVVPQIVVRPGNAYAVRWLPAMISKDVRALVEKMQVILPSDIFWWRSKKAEIRIEKDMALNLLSVFITEMITAFSGTDHADLFQNLFFKQQEYDFKAPGENEFAGGIQTWLQKYYLTQGKFRPQILVEETSDDRFLISINIQDRSRSDSEQTPLRDVLVLAKYRQHRLEILQTIATLAAFVPGLEAYVDTKGEEMIVLDREAFTPFLFQMIPVIRLLDIEILLPKSLLEILKPKASVKLKAKKGKSFLRLDQLLDFEWQVAIGDTVMSEAAFKKLLSKSDGLLKYKSKYIYVGKDDLERLHKHFAADTELSPLQMLRTALSGEYQGASVLLDDEVSALIRELTEVKEIPLPQNIRAQLRPYQQRGYSWMYRNAKIGFGSVIADDMGLGKTLQVIAALLKYKEEGMLEDKKILVVAPTGLLTNWLAEIERFAPTLATHLFHGTSRRMPEVFDILLTSYGIVRTEVARLKKIPWHSVVIDEAQNIKNPDTAQAKAIKTIKADNFIAMSGTPVENRLSELWSIMDYSNRGLLGNVKEFHTTYASPIETYNDMDAVDKLKKVTAPFMMRRLKTDKTIISDLPDKIEIDCYGTLVSEQAGLYEKTLEEAMKEIELIEPKDKKDLFVRQGLVLQMIMALKQICNHPTQYLKNNRLDPGLSGKLNLLFDKLDSIVDSGEKVLVFTQFAEMGKLLQHFIADRYSETPLFYHGGCTLKQRKDMVASFQENPADKIFILSLKAAGTGLNLTAANHVIHYDLWWNPAVEAQATDRAYRIGQKNNVMVHRFITKNTFEERINNMIQSKKNLAEMTVSTGENWIGNLSNKELKELFAMG